MTYPARPKEPVLEPDLPIVDPHHHLWDRRPAWVGQPPSTHPYERATRQSALYLFEQLIADMTGGHNITASVFIEAGAMYRADGPEELACIGETEFVNGAAAMSASGIYGPLRACAGIVGRADFTLGETTARRVLEAHVAAGNGRFRGVRQLAAYDPDHEVLGPVLSARIGRLGLYASGAFQAGFKALGQMGLSFDAWLLEPQLPDLIALARAFPDTAIVLDHVGTPLGVASYAGRREERFPIWRDNICELARSPNAFVKLGGLAMAHPGFPSFMSDPGAGSEQLAAEWRPYIEACIEAFGVDRCMFESNFPVDRGSCDYGTLWNALKRIAAGYSADEKAALFSGTARRFYRLEA